MALLWAQKLSGKHWTDYNAHDPGVTILEVMSYALTELDYKLDFKIEEILYSSIQSTAFKLEDNAFYLAEDIYYSAPVTTYDFRILVIDRIEAVSNAWILLIDAKKGLFELIVQLKVWAKPERVQMEVEALFEEQRSIAWSLDKIRVIESKAVTLNGEFYFSSEHAAEKLFAELLYIFNEKLVNEQPTSHSAQVLQAAGEPLDSIFEGPKVYNGVIIDEDLKPFYQNINLQQIKGILMKQEGLMRINDFAINIDGELHNEQIKIEDFLPFIDPQQQHHVKVFKEDKAVEIDTQEVAYQYHKLLQSTKRQYNLVSKEAPSFEIEEGTRDRSIATFYQLLQEFPTIYQIEKEESLKQSRFDNEAFKALLLPLEQLIANTMKQLAETASFFSTESPSLNYNQNPISTLKEEEVAPLSFKKKRNEVLNHMLSRFNYVIDKDLPDLHYGNHPESLAQRIRCKEKLLQHLPVISQHRISLNTKFEELGISYLEFEILLRLWIDVPIKEHLSKAVSDLELHVTKLDDEGKIMVKDYLAELYQHQLTEKERRFYLYTTDPLEELLRAGTERVNYSVQKLKEEKRFGLFLSLGDTKIQNLIHKSKNKKALLRSIDTWIDRFNEVNKKSEGFYVIDNSYLKGELNACHTVTFVFAAWSKRFQSKSFQQNVEKIVMGVMPAHLRLQFAWLNHAEMKLFEEQADKDFIARKKTKDIELTEELVQVLLSKKRD